MYSLKTPKDIYIKLVSFFQIRKANKYRAQLDQDSSDFKEYVKEKIQHDESHEFELNLSSHQAIDIDQELHKLGIPNIDGIDSNTQISSKVRKFLNNVRKKIRKKFRKNFEGDKDLDHDKSSHLRPQETILPAKVIKGDMKSRIHKSQAIASMLQQQFASTAKLRESVRATQNQAASDKGKQNTVVVKLDASKIEPAKLDTVAGQRTNNKPTIKNDSSSLNKDGKIDNQVKAVKDSDKQQDVHRKFHADAVNNVGENAAKSEWVGALSDSVVQAKGGGGGRSV